MKPFSSFLLFSVTLHTLTVAAQEDAFVAWEDRQQGSRELQRGDGAREGSSFEFLNRIRNIFREETCRAARCLSGLGVKMFLGNGEACMEICSVLPSIWRERGYACGTCPSKTNAVPSAEPAPTPVAAPIIVPVSMPVVDAPILSPVDDVPMALPVASPVALPVSAPVSNSGPFGYERSDPTDECSLNSNVAATEENTVMKFFAMGDTPYTQNNQNQLTCLQTAILPQLAAKSDVADFVVHIGDFKAGTEDCTFSLFNARKALFNQVEDGSLGGTIDFFFTPGDNEANDCSNANLNNPVGTSVALGWVRTLFADVTSPFHDFDRMGNLPSTGSPAQNVVVTRQVGQPENFFFTYKQIAFIAISEPAGYSANDSDNAAWISQNVNPTILKALVVFGHADFSVPEVRNVLQSFGALPILYVTGNTHNYCMMLDPRFSNQNLIELTVDGEKAGPELVSVIQDGSGNYYFHVDRYAISTVGGQGC